MLLTIITISTFYLSAIREPNKRYSGASWRGPLPPSNFEKLLPKRRINYLIIFTTEHSTNKAAQLWKGANEISGHYIVSRNGEVLQFVENEDIAYHAGNRFFNEHSIAVALEGYAEPLRSKPEAYAATLHTVEQFKSLVALIRWLCETYSIPMDRAHLIGKNQVPGSPEPNGAPFESKYWGGATNKYSPGNSWNWTRFMQALGRESINLVVEAQADVPVTSMPYEKAPVITTLWRGQQAVCYDQTQSHWLIYVCGVEAAQPGLPAGEYHWDGWIPKEMASLISFRKPLTSNITNGSTQLDVYENRAPREDEAPSTKVSKDKSLAATGNTYIRATGQKAVEIYLQNPTHPKTGWIYLNSP